MRTCSRSSTDSPHQPFLITIYHCTYFLSPLLPALLNLLLFCLLYYDLSQLLTKNSNFNSSGHNEWDKLIFLCVHNKNIKQHAHDTTWHHMTTSHQQKRKKLQLQQQQQQNNVFVESLCYHIIHTALSLVFCVLCFVLFVLFVFVLFVLFVCVVLFVFVFCLFVFDCYSYTTLSATTHQQQQQSRSLSLSLSLSLEFNRSSSISFCSIKRFALMSKTVLKTADMVAKMIKRW